ncbi:PurN [Desulforapulum autotrophicum HRM2]|uniref:Phosphoribosylglycinamide formyltransferase n=1 Tax=Desulforapulum autotrophicum (strain ATCC 43914 / DSM 3382 / VKM B-1955 / HRM2) TaxID=177437 RepID=C0QM40_DESAH|nr:phosphoribosylglycinamide formyltransferase [Desulforapulum autotrophicum]ACN14346.1 PurN [Desulforapulum autotrophicum HRM2]
MKKKIKAGALVSGGGTNLQAIIDAAGQGEIDVDLVFVGADNFEAKGLERAQKAGIETFVVDYRAIIEQVKNSPESVDIPDDFNLEEIRGKQSLVPESAGASKVEQFLTSRAVAERAMLDHILPHKVDLLILAGFMRTLTPYFIDRINTDRKRIMNIHPALLPAFPGTDGYGDTFRYGCRVGGCTVHFIDYGEDTGPILGQRAFDIDENDTLETIKKKGLALEWELYPECIQKFARRILG